ncbi:MAG TPA: thioredoxin reductase, partial [Ochrobactrum sp.]|nr:thioredoxin reductase [Ochrobactrum sp.]
MGYEPQNDIVIIGCGPVALFSVFQLGLFGFKCHLIEACDRPGGQCTALYA